MSDINTFQVWFKVKDIITKQTPDGDANSQKISKTWNDLLYFSLYERRLNTSKVIGNETYTNSLEFLGEDIYLPALKMKEGSCVIKFSRGDGDSAKQNLVGDAATGDLASKPNTYRRTSDSFHNKTGLTNEEKSNFYGPFAMSKGFNRAYTIVSETFVDVDFSNNDYSDYPGQMKVSVNNDGNYSNVTNGEFQFRFGISGENPFQGIGSIFAFATWPLREDILLPEQPNKFDTEFALKVYFDENTTNLETSHFVVENATIVKIFKVDSKEYWVIFKITAPSSSSISTKYSITLLKDSVSSTLDNNKKNRTQTITRHCIKNDGSHYYATHNPGDSNNRRFRSSTDLSTWNDLSGATSIDSSKGVGNIGDNFPFAPALLLFNGFGFSSIPIGSTSGTSATYKTNLRYYFSNDGKIWDVLYKVGVRNYYELNDENTNASRTSNYSQSKSLVSCLRTYIGDVAVGRDGSGNHLIIASGTNGTHSSNRHTDTNDYSMAYSRDGGINWYPMSGLSGYRYNQHGHAGLGSFITGLSNRTMDAQQTITPGDFTIGPYWNTTEIANEYKVNSVGRQDNRHFSYNILPRGLGIVYGNGTWVFLGGLQNTPNSTYCNNLWFSNDGYSWKACKNIQDTRSYHKGVYCTGTFIIYGDGGTVFYSTDGDFWKSSETTAPILDTIQDITTNGSDTVILTGYSSDNTKFIKCSKDYGKTWQDPSTNFSFNRGGESCRCIWNSSKFIVLVYGNDSKDKFLTSTDGLNWTTVSEFENTSDVLRYPTRIPSSGSILTNYFVHEDNHKYPFGTKSEVNGITKELVNSVMNVDVSQNYFPANLVPSEWWDNLTETTDAGKEKEYANRRRFLFKKIFDANNFGDGNTLDYFDISTNILNMSVNNVKETIRVYRVDPNTNKSSINLNTDTNITDKRGFYSALNNEESINITPSTNDIVFEIKRDGLDTEGNNIYYIEKKSGTANLTIDRNSNTVIPTAVIITTGETTSSSSSTSSTSSTSKSNTASSSYSSSYTDETTNNTTNNTTTTTSNTITTVCLTTSTTVNVVSSSGNKYVFNGDTTYSSTKKYGLYSTTYTFKDIPSGHPMAILDISNNYISYTGDDSKKLSKTVSGTTRDGTYDFYYGDITVTVTGDFGAVSVYCYYHGYMGGENLLEYKSSCNSY